MKNIMPCNGIAVTKIGIRQRRLRPHCDEYSVAVSSATADSASSSFRPWQYIYIPPLFAWGRIIPLLRGCALELLCNFELMVLLLIGSGLLLLLDVGVLVIVFFLRRGDAQGVELD